MGLGMLGCGAKCAKCLLFVFNVFFWLGGLALVALGVWFLVDSSSLSHVVSFVSEFDELDSNDSGLKMSAYIFIAVGAFVLVVGFCGCCGALKENKCLLVLYIIFIVLIIGAQIAGGVLAYLYRKEVEDNVKELGTTYIKETYTNSKAADYGLNWIQYTYTCCGINGAGDYQHSSFSNATGNIAVSPFCCHMKSGYKFDKRHADPHNSTACDLEAQQCMSGNCPSSSTVLHIKGCLPSILDWIKKNLPIFIGIALGIAGVEIFGIVLAVCLCRQSGKKD